MALLLFSMNIEASEINSEVNTEKTKSNTQKRVEHLLTLIGACGIGCVSGNLCARFCVDPNSDLMKELPLLNFVILIIWGLCEAKLMDHVTDDLKSLDISYSEGLLRYTVWSSSWLSWIYTVNQIAR